LIGALTIAFASNATVAMAQLTIPPAGMTEAEFEALINAEISLDLATVLPPGTLVIDNFCYQDSFAGCLGRVDVTIDGNPAPSIGGQTVDVGALSGGFFLPVDLGLQDLAITAKVKAVTGIGFTCYIDIANTQSTIFSDMLLFDDPLFPGQFFDVTQAGSVNVVFGGFSDNTDCDGFLGFIVEALISLFIGDLQDLLETSLANVLNAVDGEGNTPIAAAVEVAYLTPPLVPALGRVGLGILLALLSIGAIVAMAWPNRPEASRD
jgi:hypothetical protein